MLGRDFLLSTLHLGADTAALGRAEGHLCGLLATGLRHK